MQDLKVLQQNAQAFAMAGRHPNASMNIREYGADRARFLEALPYEVGARTADCTTIDASCMAGHGRAVTPLPAEPCPVLPPRCDCHVIGGNTLNGGQIGVATLAGRFGQITINSGDASYFVPYYIFVQAFITGATPDDTIAGLPLPVLLIDSRSGRAPNLRRARDNDPAAGILCTVYADQKQIECVDWNRFSSVNNQELILRFYNPNDNAIHVFVDLWGIPAA